MEKDFDEWNGLKKLIDNKQEILYFREGEIWWIHSGLNVRFEMNGKGGEFMRPVIVIKKYNKYSFLALPLSTSKTINKYKIPVGLVDGKEAVAALSQIKNTDSKRLVNKIGFLEKELFESVKEKTSRINFG